MPVAPLLFPARTSAVDSSDSQNAGNATTRNALRQAVDWLGWSYSGIHN